MADISSRYFSEQQFRTHYAAAAFAAHVDLPCDTSVTLAWPVLGAETAEQVQAGLAAFVKCQGEWMRERRIVHVHFYVHEHGPVVGSHTHLNVFIPEGDRREYRTWVQEWVERRIGEHVPNAVRVRGPARKTPWLHWLGFHYQMKGYDPDAVVRYADWSPDGRPVMLGDLIAFPWRDPGPVALHRRCGHADLLGAGQQARGHVLAPSPRRQRYAKKRPAVGARPDIVWRQIMKSGPHPWGPFRSSYDNGCRDVRRLYPPEFWQRVQYRSWKGL